MRNCVVHIYRLKSFGSYMMSDKSNKSTSQRLGNTFMICLEKPELKGLNLLGLVSRPGLVFQPIGIQKFQTNFFKIN